MIGLQSMMKSVLFLQGFPGMSPIRSYVSKFFLVDMDVLGNFVLI